MPPAQVPGAGGAVAGGQVGQVVGEKAEPALYLGAIVAAVGPEQVGGVRTGRPGVDEGSDELVEQVGA